MRGGEHAAGAIQYRAEVVPAAGLHFADVDRHSHVQRLQLAPVGRGELTLGLAGGSHRCGDVGERKADAVPGALYEPPSGRLGRAQHDPIVLGDRRPHGVRVQLPGSGRVFDVGEQEGERLHLRLRLEQEGRLLVEDPPLEFLQLR
jgi:hypothetical protein